MSSNSDGPEIRMSFMLKRSLGKSFFTQENYKNRFFVLYPTCLKYFEGSLDKGRGREKGCIELRWVKAVAPVADGELDDHKYAFQVVYEENGEQLTLYVVAGTEAVKKQWITSLREECKKLEIPLSREYHPGVWNKRKGEFSCCNQVLKSSGGCVADPDVISDVIPPGLRGLSISLPQNNSTRKESNASGEKRVAMFDYKATEPNDLDLSRGEEYTILDNSKENWWLVKNRRGQSGYVPSNYLRDLNSLEAYAWYFRNISRPRCEALLKEEGRDGTFLVRDSVQKPGCYTLSVFSFEGDLSSGGCTKHYHIRKTAKGFCIATTHVFPSIPEVINYHKVNGAGLVTRLKNVPNQSAPTVSLGSNKWEINANELQMFEEIGRGQFGCVRRGEWKAQTQVAIKMMNPQAMSEDDFIQEARTMTQLQHPNLVQLYGVCTKKPIFIVVEYMANGSLNSYLKRNRPALLLRIPILLDMCVQVCGAMEYLESRTVIHRDLAARNCLIHKNNTVKVCDFGLARFVADDEYTSSTGTKFPVRWAPPEVIHYSRFSSKSDVWAFGVLMWEIFSFGAQPYGRIHNREVAALLEKGGTLDRPDVCPGPVYKVMKRCWLMKPDSRPNFTEMLSYLDSIIERDYQD